MADVTLADLMKKREENLDSRKEERIEKIREKIDLTDKSAISLYGSGVEMEIADLSNMVLKYTKENSVDDSRELMDKLLRIIDPEEGKDRGSFEKLRAQVESMEAELEKNRMALLKYLDILDRLFEKNVEYDQYLELYILAGEQEEKHIEEKLLPALKAEARTLGSGQAALAVRDYESALGQFEGRINDLKVSKAMSAQTGAQISLLQEGVRLLWEKIRELLDQTLPLWKKQMALNR